MAEGVMSDLVLKGGYSSKVEVDSCGTASYHVGDPPDRRTMKTLAKHGIDHYKHVGRQLSPRDFQEFDYVLGMDEDNMIDIKESRSSSKCRAKVALLGSYDPQGMLQIADPYYSHDPKAFDRVYEQCVRCCSELLKEILGS